MNTEGDPDESSEFDPVRGEEKSVWSCTSLLGLTILSGAFWYVVYKLFIERLAK